MTRKLAPVVTAYAIFNASEIRISDVAFKEIADIGFHHRR
jgi:hypothetical protein